MNTMAGNKSIRLKYRGKIIIILAAVFGCLLLWSFRPQGKVNILMAGDSTMAEKPEKAFPENGWGMALERRLLSSASITNYARNGRSTKSFKDEGLWEKLYQQITPGDFVIIQFGHNDEKKQDSTRYTEPWTSYTANLRKFVTDTRTKGGLPVLCTPIVRRKFDPEGKLVNTHGEYPAAVRALAEEMQVPLIDLEMLTANEVNTAGPEKSARYYLLFGPGEYANFPEGKEDNTHLRVEGADKVAELFINELRRLHLPLENHVR